MVVKRQLGLKLVAGTMLNKNHPLKQFCQTSVFALRLEVDFVFPLSKQQEQEEEQQPLPNISTVTDPILTKL